MKLYLLKTENGLYLADMEVSIDSIPEIGAINLLTDGNYYKNLHIAAHKEEDKYFPGLENWFKWVKEEALPNNWLKISEEFPFDPTKVKIVEFNEIN